MSLVLIRNSARKTYELVNGPTVIRSYEDADALKAWGQAQGYEVVKGYGKGRMA